MVPTTEKPPMTRFFTALMVVMFTISVNGCSDAPSTNISAGSTGCMSDLACPQGAVCLRQGNDTYGACRSGECNRERTCSQGLRCDLVGLVCVEPPAMGCQGNSCPQGQRCDPVSSRCIDETEQPCESNAQCMRGFCVNGSCMEVECVSAADCKQDQECSAQFRCVDILEECQDGDGDGYGFGPCLGADCDDGDPNVNPGVSETGEENCGDGIDNDCDGRDSVCLINDRDQDGYSEADGDCNDDDPTMSPGLSELPYNGKDDDCNAATSDEDVDRDGFLAREVGGDDCDDNNPIVNPDGVEIPGNNIDEDCNDMDGIPTELDADDDGFSEAQGDCLDTDPDVYPGRTESPYNGRDDDCNEATPDDDLDEDGFVRALDCDDENPNVNPSSREVYYNGIDDDCDPTTSDDDADGDGYRALAVAGDDCSDESSEINPGREEVPYNGLDDDCNPTTPDDDLDRDGFTVADGDCDDSRAIVSPVIIENGRENCSDGIDNNCVAGDVVCDLDAEDIDGDGILPPADCEPNNPEIPGIAEILGNGLDDDCEPTTPDLLPQCTDDQFDELESNLTYETATALEDGNTSGIQYGGLILCHRDEDWYSIVVQRGDGLEFDLFFDHDQADLDLELYREESDGSITQIDASISVTNNETVYLRSSVEEQTRYFARVFRYVDLYVEAPYQLSVNVFDRCVDDPEGASGEQNDDCINTDPSFAQCLRENASQFPPVGERRQICDYDSDMYTFYLAQQQSVRVDVLFSNADGDLDVVLRDEQGNLRAMQSSTSDNESLVELLSPGRYYVTVSGYRAAQNDYVVVLSSDVVDRVDARPACVPLEECPLFGECCARSRDLVDYNAQGYGVLEEQIQVDAPAGAVIRRLTIKDLRIEHSYLRDLRVSMGWDGEERLVLWNLQGDENGRDAGVDDDFFSDRDIDLDNRMYSEFAGLPARGTFFIRVEDQLAGDTGRLESLEVEVEYLQPLL